MATMREVTNAMNGAFETAMEVCDVRSNYAMIIGAYEHLITRLMRNDQDGDVVVEVLKNLATHCGERNKRAA